MRQFVRVRFRKFDDGALVNGESYSPLFITPNECIQSILTEQQSLDIVGHPLLLGGKSGLAKQLLPFVTQKCQEYDVITGEIKRLRQNPNAEDRLIKEENKLDSLVRDV